MASAASFTPPTTLSLHRKSPLSKPLNFQPPRFSVPVGPDITPSNSSNRFELHAVESTQRRLQATSDSTTNATLLPPTSPSSASTVIRNFYEGINRHNLESITNLVAENCTYEDLIFPNPFTGRKAILDFFKKFTDYTSTDLKFVIDDISDEDSSVVGVKWHLEWKGKDFPFSKGCSFYRLEVNDGIRQIVYARDSVEPAIKPGESALVVIRGVTMLLQRFPQLQEWLP